MSAWPPSIATFPVGGSCLRPYTRKRSTSCVRPQTRRLLPRAKLWVIWLRRFAVFHATKHPIAAELLRHTEVDDPVFGGSRDRVLAAGRPLLLAAQQAHEARNDLTLDQVLDLVLAATTIPGDRAYVEPIFQAALDGLRA